MTAATGTAVHPPFTLKDGLRLVGHRLRPYLPATAAAPPAQSPPPPAAGWFRPDDGDGGTPAPDANALLAHLPDIVVRFDRGLRHVFVNAALERVSGRAPQTFLGKTLREVNNPGDFSVTLETHLRQVFATGEERFFDHVDPTGARCFALCLTPEFTPDGDGVGLRRVESVLVISHDVTRRWLAEQERDRSLDELRRANERLRTLAAEKDAFLGMCSHDLRNPLADILMAAALLRESPRDPELAAEMGGVTHRSAEFMLSLVNNLLDVTAIEAGEFPLALAPLDLYPLVERVVQSHQTRAAAKDITLHLAPRSAPDGGGDPGGFRVTADRHATVQILDNLVSNALKFTPPGGRVDVRPERRGEEGRVGVAVEDTGPGLSKADQVRLFGKFARLSARPTGGERSSGLGLSIVKRLAEAMHGRVWCESEPGQGATFRVELPAVEGA